MIRLRSSLPILAALGFTAAGSLALASAPIEKNLPLEPGGHLTVKTVAGEVVVKGTSENGARIRITAAEGEDLEAKLRFRFESTPGEATVIAERKGDSWFSGFFTTRRLRFEILVPAKTRVDVDTGGGGIDISALEGAARLETSGGGITVSRHTGPVDGETSGGGIEVKDVKGDVKIETSGGGIEVSHVTGTLKATTSGGSIEVTDVSGDAAVETSGGSIDFDKAGGRVVAESSAGSVEIAFTPGNAKGGKIETSAGSVSVKVDPSVGLEIEAEASGGGVSSDIPLKLRGSAGRSHLSGTMGSGGAKLEIETSAGSIEIGSLAI